MPPLTRSPHPDGLFYKAQVIAGLLEAGYTVVTPDALKSLGYWQTNLRKYATAADLAHDFPTTRPLAPTRRLTPWHMARP